MTRPDESLRSALAERYTIERELGRGGYSVVYLAHDIKHDRKVALKVLQPELALAVRHERFLREIQIAAKLSHPHILPLHDSGEAGGTVYYVMPYVEGESLRDRLTREKQLPVADALRITREVADALDYAHRQGVVHRDIKPENILLHEGHALVADFGIARALTAAGGQTVTESGIAVGTPAYMSPEQGAASGEPDARSDIYSLGCVLYEMLVGHPPFTGATAQEILSRHALDPLPTVRAARNAVPEFAELTIQKALAKQPADRHATAGDLAEALRGDAPVRSAHRLRQMLAGTALAAGAVVAVWLLGYPSALASDRSVAVSPCINLRADADNEYFSDAITDDLINSLTQVEGLRVPARTSSFAFKGRSVDIREIGSRLNVAHVVECSVRFVAPLLRVQVGLARVKDGAILWSARYERQLNGTREFFQVEDEITREITGTLRMRFADSAAVVLARARRTTESPAALDLYQRGRYFWYRRQRDDLEKAIEYFRQAVALDGGFAMAHSGLSDAYAAAGFSGFLSREDAYPKAKESALRALALDSTLAEAHSSLARVYQVYDWNFRAADSAYRRAIALDPRYAMARAFYATFLARGMGRRDEAIRHATAARELEPLSGVVINVASIALLHARRYDDAIAYAGRAVELMPDFGQTHGNLANGYRWTGRYAEALAEYDTAARLGPRVPRAQIADIYVRTGRRAEAVMILKQLETQPSRQNAWGDIARLHVVLGELDQAFEALDSAITQRSFNAEPPLAGAPEWDPLRSDPRFERLLERIGVPR